MIDIASATPRTRCTYVVHEYFGVTRETLWKTACEDLPSIVEPLRKPLG
jgi:uncharacterized protein with HEPN domain